MSGAIYCDKHDSYKERISVCRHCAASFDNGVSCESIYYIGFGNTEYKDSFVVICGKCVDYFEVEDFLGLFNMIDYYESHQGMNKFLRANVEDRCAACV